MTQYCVYILKIDNEPIYKIGKTNKLRYRLVNLCQALYQKFEVYRIIPCPSNEEAKMKERFLLDVFEDFRIPHKREWFNIPSVDIINDILEKVDDVCVFTDTTDLLPI